MIETDTEGIISRGCGKGSTVRFERFITYEHPDTDQVKPDFLMRLHGLKAVQTAST